MSWLRTSEHTFFILFAGGALAACTANSVAQPSAMGSGGSASDGSASDGSASAHDAGLRSLLSTRTRGLSSRIASMVCRWLSAAPPRAAASHPTSPHRLPVRCCRSLRFRGERCSPRRRDDSRDQRSRTRPTLRGRRERGGGAGHRVAASKRRTREVGRGRSGARPCRLTAWGLARDHRPDRGVILARTEIPRASRHRVPQGKRRGPRRVRRGRAVSLPREAAPSLDDCNSIGIFATSSSPATVRFMSAPSGTQRSSASRRAAKSPSACVQHRDALRPSPGLRPRDAHALGGVANRAARCRNGRRTHASPNGCGRCCRHGSWWVRWQVQWRHRASGTLASRRRELRSGPCRVWVR